MHTHVSRSQSGRRERPENDAELQPSKAEAVQRQALEATRRQSLVQAKLSVGPADDVYEREADAVADRVVRSLAAPSMMAAAGSGERVRRSAMPVSNITKIAPGAGRVRRFATVGVDGGELDADTDAAISASRGGGKAMGQDVRRKMEGAFGADFGGIRIHEGSKASELNNRIQAKAFTVGNDIYFRDGAPDASSRDGQHLLAHELTHTVQQGGRVQRSTDQIQRHTDIVQRGFMDSLKGLFGGKSGGKGMEIGGPTNGKDFGSVGQYDQAALKQTSLRPVVSTYDNFYTLTLDNVSQNWGQKYTGDGKKHVSEENPPAWVEKKYPRIFSPSKKGTQIGPTAPQIDEFVHNAEAAEWVRRVLNRWYKPEELKFLEAVNVYRKNVSRERFMAIYRLYVSEHGEDSVHIDKGVKAPLQQLALSIDPTADNAPVGGAGKGW
jgi:hypothetical protein